MADGTETTKVTGGIRTTAETFEDRRAAALAQAQSEGYELTEARPSAAGPDPYSLKRADSPLEEAEKKIRGKDAEVAIPGSTLTDTGAKIEKNPDRQVASDYMEQPVAGTPTEEAHAVAPEGSLAADNNPGSAIHGAEIFRGDGNQDEQAADADERPADEQPADDEQRDDS